MSKTWQEEESFPEGVNLLFAILTRYPEISCVHMSSQEKVLKLTFFATHAADEEEIRKLGELLLDSVNAYHLLEGYAYEEMEFEYAFHEGVTFLTVIRDVPSLSRGELSLLAQLLRERLGERLVVDYQPEPPPGTEEMPGDEEYLDSLFQTIRRVPAQTLVGMREEGRVLVYTQ